MNSKNILFIILMLGWPLIVQPMHPHFAEIEELARRKEKREAEAKRFRLRTRETEKIRALQAGVLNYWQTIKHAIEKGGLQELLKQADEQGLHISVTRKDPSGNTILHYAAEFNKPAIIQKYLVNDFSPDPINKEGYTPLMIAAREGSIEAAQTLIMKRARINVGTQKAKSFPLLEAVENNNWIITRLLLEHDANLNFKGPAPYSAFEYLKELKDINLFERLLAILNSLGKTKQRKKWIDQVADQIADLKQKERREIEKEWVIIEKKPKSEEELAHKKTLKEAPIEEPLTIWQRIFGK